ncbi:YhdH/YhfP family quinone oxidoreductase [Capilliphycus salinus ALCB114379]|uniref:YhdH/YhfP family quinone oxidoreductase n=1 Tax=Capilliphycus salinus TaxID=2768948 RepID=UPI0039A59DEA
MSATFKALQVTQTPEQQFTQEVVNIGLDKLPPGDVLIRVHYSSLNYKDALSATGNRGVTRQFPHIPGIDAAGIVVNSNVPQFKPNDLVMVTGYDLGMNTWGGFAEYIRVPAEWVVPLPSDLTLQESMILGTAGLTAALSVNGLIQQEITPSLGEVLVTGSTGGVGSLAVSILAKLGYSVVAVTGKSKSHDFLKKLGAKLIINRSEIDEQTGKPLLKERWAGVIDTVGGNLLATAIKSTQYGGCVTACGLVAGANLTTTVYPFILRGVRLIGIDSVQCSMDKRLLIWSKLAAAWKPTYLDELVTTISLEQLPEKISEILQGNIQGRILVDLR